MSAPQPPARRGLWSRLGSTRRTTTGYRTWRDFMSWIMGLAIIVHEVWFEPVAELYPLIVGVTLAGLPLVLPGSDGLFGRDSRTPEPPEPQDPAPRVNRGHGVP